MHNNKKRILLKTSDDNKCEIKNIYKIFDGLISNKQPKILQIISL